MRAANLLTASGTIANLFVMLRNSRIAAVLDFRPKAPGARRLTCAFCLLLCVLVSFCLVGCSGRKKEPAWEQIKIGDLTPYRGDKPPQVQPPKATNLEVHVFEIPAENIGKLDKIRGKLFVQPLRLNNFRAFTANSFSVRFGRLELFEQIVGLLLAAGGQKVTEVSLTLPDSQAETIAIGGFNRQQTIFYTSIDGSREAANVGPGVLGLRIKAGEIPGLRGACDVVAYPVFSLPTRSTIPQLDALGKLRDFAFTAAAFGLNMGPGDFLLLAPKAYVSDQTTLGGMFFSNPRGSLFLNEAGRKPPERKPAVRIFLLLCTWTNY
jgi:hypothetical protein